ncbi:GTP-binding protein, partial [Bullifex sp.]|uniref:GTP-binding protein n=1 Tax=Bullifex sp. TaxID=2815808 RepID=UPI002A810FDF
MSLITGIVAHVDAGKTTLSEAILFKSGAIRKYGRVDSRNTFLDTDIIERKRGITIFSKDAIVNDKITLLDTPGHVDLVSEMERTINVLDAAILLISAPDGIQAHTRTLWAML